MDIRKYNQTAWDKQVDSNENPWTKPVSPEVVARARTGDFEILLTETKPVPLNWFPKLQGLDILCLASGGGQQGPILAATGANVTVFDNSPRQLEQDRLVAEREGLDIRLVEGDAADLSLFSNESFDVVFNPCSTVFMKDVRPVWREAFRVLRRGGFLMTGVMNPLFYIFDLPKLDVGILEVKNSIPYSDLDSLSQEEFEEQILKEGIPVEFGHSLTDLLGGQCAVGFQIVDLYEDTRKDSVLSKYHPSYIATRALKP
jgi:ubiquinone/menaquinone biosynthesis C-methylase UbiE